VIELGVNIDHVATVRQARRTYEPDPVWAAVEAHLGGADGITCHLREDRRHIQDRDIWKLREVIQTRLNLEMANTPEILGIALNLKPDIVCVVPERRQEITTEGGLDVASQVQRLKEATTVLKGQGIRVALFIDPDPRQIEAAAETGAPVVELHTGAYAESSGSPQATELERLHAGARQAAGLGLEVHAGHGLHYHNVQPIASIREIVELNIGHSIISRAVFDGLATAVREMKTLMLAARA
jgi:pyridoxine 5-phosphate synthase